MSETTKEDCNEAQNVKRLKVSLDTSVSLNLKLSTSVDLISDSYKSNQSLEFVEVIHKPFKCVRLKNFIANENFLHELKPELNELEFCPKNNDLYKFSQSQDLKNVKINKVSELCDFFELEVLPFVKRITDIELNNTIDLTVSKYGYTG